MPIRTSAQTTIVSSDNGAKFASADGAAATFIVDPADGGSNITISVHAAGVMYASKGDSVTCNGIYTFTQVAL